MGTYEIVGVLRPDLDDEALGAALERVNQRIAEHGGHTSSVERWGKRRLAYPIQKHRDGYYALFVFTLDAGRITPLRQILGLSEELLRFTLATHRAKPAPAGAQPAGSASAPPASAPAATGPPPAAPAPAAGPAPAAPAPGFPSRDGQSGPVPGTPHV